jgi:hypothetical protein
MIESKARNLLIGSGAYSHFWLIATPLSFGDKVYRGTFASTALLLLVTHVPIALVAVGVGA